MLIRLMSETKLGISIGLPARHGRSKRPSAQRQTAHRVSLPTSTPSVIPKPSLPLAISSHFTSLTRVARYALLFMGMTSYKRGCEI